jgi:hypothetical protein
MRDIDPTKLAKDIERLRYLTPKHRPFLPPEAGIVLMCGAVQEQFGLAPEEVGDEQALWERTNAYHVFGCTWLIWAIFMKRIVVASVYVNNDTKTYFQISNSYALHMPADDVKAWTKTMEKKGS